MHADIIMRARIQKELMQIVFAALPSFQRELVDAAGEGVHEEVLTWRATDS